MASCACPSRPAASAPPTSTPPRPTTADRRRRRRRPGLTRCRAPRRGREWDREIARLAIPAFGALVAEPLYLLADTAVVGHLGTDQLAGLAVAAAILLTAHSLCTFLAYGTTSAVARLLGAGDEREAAHQAVQGLWLGALLGTALAALGWIFATPLIGVLTDDPAVAAEAEVYLRISLPGLPALLLVLAGTGYLRGLQDTRTPLVVALVSATANLVMEVVLIYGFDQGIGASALTTVLAQWGAAAVYLRVIGRAARGLGVAIAPHAASLRRLLVVAQALVVRTLALRGSLVLATAVAARIGTEDLAAHQISFELWSAFAFALDAVAIAGQAIIGRLLGAAEVERAGEAGRRMLQIGLGTGRGGGPAGPRRAPVPPGALQPRPGGERAHLVPAPLRRRPATAQRRRVRARRPPHRRRRPGLPRPGDGRWRRSPSRRRPASCSSSSSASAGCGSRSAASVGAGDPPAGPVALGGVGRHRRHPLTTPLDPRRDGPDGTDRRGTAPNPRRERSRMGPNRRGSGGVRGPSELAGAEGLADRREQPVGGGEGRSSDGCSRPAPASSEGDTSPR